MYNMENFIEVQEILSVHCGQEGMFSIQIQDDNGEKILIEFQSYDFLMMFDSQAINCIKDNLIKHIKNK